MMEGILIFFFFRIEEIHNYALTSVIMNLLIPFYDSFLENNNTLNIFISSLVNK